MKPPGEKGTASIDGFACEAINTGMLVQRRAEIGLHEESDRDGPEPSAE